MKREEKSRQTIFAIRDWRKKNGGEFRGAKSKCAEDLNLSYQTVINKWEQAEPKEETVKQADHNKLNSNDTELDTQATVATANTETQTECKSVPSDQTLISTNDPRGAEQAKVSDVEATLAEKSFINLMKNPQQDQNTTDDKHDLDIDVAVDGKKEIYDLQNNIEKEEQSVAQNKEDEIDPALRKAEERALIEGIKPSDGAKPYVKQTEEAKPKKESFLDRLRKKLKKDPTSSKKTDTEQEDQKKIKANRKIQNSYLDSSNRYRDRFRELAAQNTWLKIYFVAGMLVLLGAFALVIEISNRSSFIPYVITVDQHGNAVSTGIAKPVANKIEDRVIRAALTGFINNLRTVTVDKIMLAEQQWNIYSMLDQNDPAYQKSVEWLTGEDPETDGKTPFERAASEIVHVKFVSVVNMTPDTLQIEWIETARDRKGQKKAPAKPMRALITWKKGVAPSELDGIQRNPYGIFVRDFSWTEIH